MLLGTNWAVGEGAVSVLRFSLNARLSGTACGLIPTCLCAKATQNFVIPFSRQGKLTDLLQYGQMRPLYHKNLQRICTDGPQ